MKLRTIGLFLLATVSLLALTVSVQADDKKNQFFGSHSDVSFAGDLWASLEKNRLVGKNSINVYPFNGNQPHGAIQQVLDTEISVKGRAARVIVKRNHGGKNATVKSVYSDPTSYLKAITVMFKRETGYDSENLDWFWAKFTPSGKLAKNPKGTPLAGQIAKETTVGCIACHKAIGGADLETLTEK